VLLPSFLKNNLSFLMSLIQFVYSSVSVDSFSVSLLSVSLDSVFLV